MTAASDVTFVQSQPLCDREVVDIMSEKNEGTAAWIQEGD